MIVIPKWISLLIIAGGPIAFLTLLIFPDFARVSTRELTLGFMAWIVFFVIDHFVFEEERKEKELRKSEREMMAFYFGEENADAALRDYLRNIWSPELQRYFHKKKRPLNRNNRSKEEEQ